MNEPANEKPKWYFSIRREPAAPSGTEVAAESDDGAELVERLIGAGAVDCFPGEPESKRILLLEEAMIVREERGSSPSSLVAKLIFTGSEYDACRLLWVLVRSCEPIGLHVYDEQLSRPCSRDHAADSVNFIRDHSAADAEPLTPDHKCYLWCLRTCGVRLSNEEALLSFLPPGMHAAFRKGLATAKEAEILGIVLKMAQGCPYCAERGKVAGPMVTFGWHRRQPD